MALPVRTCVHMAACLSVSFERETDRHLERGCTCRTPFWVQESSSVFSGAESRGQCSKLPRFSLCSSWVLWGKCGEPGLILGTLVYSWSRLGTR